MTALAGLGLALDSPSDIPSWKSPGTRPKSGVNPKDGDCPPRPNGKRPHAARRDDSIPGVMPTSPARQITATSAASRERSLSPGRTMDTLRQPPWARSVPAKPPKGCTISLGMSLSGSWTAGRRTMKDGLPGLIAQTILVWSERSEEARGETVGAVSPRLRESHSARLRGAIKWGFAASKVGPFPPTTESCSAERNLAAPL